AKAEGLVSDPICAASNRSLTAAVQIGVHLSARRVPGSSMVKQVSFSSRKAPRIVESRKARRRPADLRAKIVSTQSSSAVNCKIQDISESGASIRVSESSVIPTQFFLVLSHTGVIYEAEVVWVAYAQRGIRFVRSYDHTDRVPPWLEPWRR